MDEDVQAVAALQVSGALSDHVRLRNVMVCPHCHEGFGSASLAIHIMRCRALYPEEELTKAEKKPPKPKKEIRSLVDLCLRFVTKHFESICLEKIVAFPEAEAALIASMPTSLVHRLVINLVKNSKQVNRKNHEMRAEVETLARSLGSAKRNSALLEAARSGEAMMRTRMGEQQEIAHRVERELDTTKAELTTAEAENRQLRAKIESVEKIQLRLEAKINALTAEKDTLKKATQESQRREMEATRQLALVKKSSGTTASPSRRPSSSVSRASRHSAVTPAKMNRSLADPGRVRKPRIDTTPVVLRERPRSDGSKIPFPASIARQADNVQQRP